jgi:putative DNA primase
MQAKELKEYLYKHPDKLISVLEHFGFHKISITTDEIRCAKPDGRNATSVAVSLQEELYASCFSNNYNGDFLGMIENVKGFSFYTIIKSIHHHLGLKLDHKSNHVDLLGDIRKYKKSNKEKQNKNVFYPKSVLNKYIPIPHFDMINEGIAPSTLKKFDIRFDPEKSRIIIPHMDWEESDKVVGIVGRHAMRADLLEDLGIPKYWNYITGYSKSSNLYGWQNAKNNIDKSNMLIIFESEKSVMKQDTIEQGNGFAVSVGGHSISDTQVKFIIQSTSIDCEIVIAFDKDVTSDTEEMEQLCDRFNKFRTASYIHDKYNILESHDAPIDRGVKRWKYLLKHRKQVSEGKLND